MTDLKSTPYILGLDIGIASVGAALLADDHILGLHVRTFDRAETAKEGKSLNLIRRESRLVRRRLHRRAFRLQRLRAIFLQQGLIETPEPSAFRTNISPWSLRAEGLDRQLTAQEWAATLYHIVKHRGFQSNRKSEIKADEKAGQMLSGVNHNQSLLETSGLRTAGELAAKHNEFSIAKRNKGGTYNHTFSRTDLEYELEKLFSAQRQFNNDYTSIEFEHAVHELLMARRPALSGKKLLKMVGTCTFEENEFRAPRASYSAQRFVWLGKLNNLRISQLGSIRGLTNDERSILIDLPFQKSKLTYKQVRNELDLEETERFIGLRYPNGTQQSKNPEDTTLFEPREFHTLRKAYIKAGLKLEWARDSQNPERIDDLAYALTVFKEDSEAQAWMSAQCIEENIIDAVLSESFSTFVRLSLKALRKITPHMEAGLRYDEAVIAAGYQHHSQLNINEKSRYIPRPSRDQLTNPVVYRALNQARKLVNAIVREYGPPSSVHIELARDLSRPLDERRKIEKLQGEYQENKKSDITQFEETFTFTPKGLDLIKWRLFREQDSKCAYSLRAIDVNRLFETGYVEIDHALPRSRSFDNSMNNKVLVLTAENRNKGNQTPYEYLDGKNESDKWRAFTTFVSSNHKYRQAKRNTLLRKDFGKEAALEFRERHLTDTRYICKAFKLMVEQHLRLRDDAEKRCVVVSGQLTSFLRARWGLIKVRQDGDLHHALDAAVVAACTHSMVKRLSDYSRHKELEFARGDYIDYDSGEVIDITALRKLEHHFPLPWPLFRDELKARLSSNPSNALSMLTDYPDLLAKFAQPIRVSRAPTRRGLGAAHQETIRSAKHLAQGKSSIKTPLEKIKLKDLPNIVGFDDPRNKTLIEAIETRLKAHNDDPKKAFQEALYRPASNGKQAPQVRSVKLLATQKSGISVRGGIANNGDMVRTDIFTDGKYFYAVPLYVADTVKPELPSIAVTRSKTTNGGIEMDDKFKFMFSLYPNDWISVQVKENEPAKTGYYAGLDRSTGAISLWAHDRNRLIGKEGLIRGIGIKSAKTLEKYHVDFLGRLHRVHNETRQPLK